MKPASPRLRLIVLAVSAAFADCALGQATPNYNSTQAGSATVSQTGSATAVSQTSQRAVLLWNSFNVGNGASVTFTQPNSSAIAVNRVSAAGGLSTIDGALTANGNVMILNPNGVLFGATASVNVAGLIASTGDINPASNFADFMAGGAVAITGATSGSISNAARPTVPHPEYGITVTNAGLVAFVAPSVSNSGVITATSGRITLASAQAATVSLNGGLYEIAVTQGMAGGSISNTGTLSAAGGAILLSALDAANLVSGAINLEGIQQASRVEVNGGHVTLKSDLDAATVVGASAIVDVCHCGQIQDGIDIARAGGTVNVSAGTYNEQLTITKSLTLAGEGASQTIVAPTALAADANGMKNILTIGGSAATNANVSGFTFTGPVAGITSGIFVRDGAHASIHDNKVTDIRESVAISGDQTGVGIFVGRAKFSTSGTADIFNNQITGYQKGGIVVDGPGSQATITGNTIVGEGPTAAIAQNGIQVSRGASATLSGNTVRGNVYTGVSSDPDDFAAGILFFNSDASFGTGGIGIAASNVITANQFGIWVNDPVALPTISVAGASGNTRNAVAFINGGYAGQGASLEYPAWSAPATTFVNSSAYSSGQTGDIADTGVGGAGVKGWSGFASIQPAIDAVVGGGRVNIAGGTYTQANTLNVNKSITLAGAGQDATIIDAHGVHGYGISVTADHVTLTDFTVFGPAVYDTHLSYYASSYGIKVAPGGGPTSRLQDFHISNVTSRGAGKAELDLNGVVGATIDHVTADGTPYGASSGMTQGAGIQITDSANVEIKNSTTLNNAWGGIALYQSNRAFPDQQTTGITVRSSNHLTEVGTAANPLSGPLYLQDESASKDFGVLTLEGFAYAVRNSDSASTNNQYTFLQYTLGGAFDVAANLAAPTQSYIQGWNVSAVNHNFYVGMGHVTGALQAMSIMKAVDTASAGDTVNVAPGSYTETASNRTIPGVPGTYTLGLLLDKSLTLRGIDASGAPITSADNVQAWIRSNAITDFGMTIGVTANDVTVEGLGFKPYSGAPINKTIEIQADNFVFRNNVVDNRFEAGTGGTRAGGGGALYFGENDPAGHPINRLTVTGNKFYDGSVVLTNGVGANGTTYSPAVGTTYTPASGRVISGNAFIGSSNYTFGGLLLNGYMSDIGWRKMPIGAATIAGNTFSGFDESVLVRGDQQGVDLRQVMASNSFDRAVLVTDSSGNARGELYQSTPDVQHLKYSIQSSIQSGVNRSLIGDTISVGTGTYAENVVVNGPRNFVLSGPTVHSMVFNANTGIAGNATADGAGFTFNAPVVLTGNTSLATTGGNIAFNGDIQNFGATSYALSLVTGAGDIFLTSGGGQSNPIGQFNVLANDFTLSGTLWVTGYNLGASGNIALSDHSLHATASGGVNVLSASGDITGAAFSESPLIVNSGGDVVLIMSAPTGSTVRAAKTASVQNVGTGVIDVNGERQPNTRVVSLDNNRIVPPDNALPREGRVPTAPTPGGGGEIQATADNVGEALDHGWPVEIDLTPGRRKR